MQAQLAGETVLVGNSRLLALEGVVHDIEQARAMEKAWAEKGMLAPRL